MASELNYKIVLVGANKVGKTTFVKKHRTNKFEKKYLATLGVEVHPIRFNTNHGRVCFNIWDTAGDPKYVGLADGYYIRANGAILMWDGANPSTQDVLDRYRGEITNVCGDIPMVTIKHKRGGSRDKESICVSSKDGINLEKPFLELAKELMGFDDLCFLP